MLPSRNRLRSSRDFTATTRGGRRAASGTLVVHLRSPQEPSSEPVKVGLTVGKAVGNAVARHRVSRQLRHVARGELDRLPSGSIMVIRALAGAGSATSAQLAHDLTSALANLRGRKAS